MFTLAIAAALGAVAVGTVGWLGSGEKFDVKKYAGTIITGAISAMGIALTFSGAVSSREIALAFLAGAGVDSGRVAISNAIAARKNKAP